MIRVLSVHKGWDTAGIGYLLAECYRGDPEVHVRATARRTNYIGYPRDLDWADAPAEWDRAKVAHLHNTLGTWSMFGQGKPFVLHSHGTYYRNHADAVNAAVAQYGGRHVVATLDLLDYGDATWCPAPYQDYMLPERHKVASGRLRVGHAPTDRTIKSTDAFLTACRKLDVEPVLIERQSWAECLALKATCDVYFDQVKLGYGHNAIEAWAMGIPVIAGATPGTLARMRDTFGALPFYEATEQTIGDAIEALMDWSTRLEYTDRGYQHVKRWHDGAATREVLTPIYRALA